MPSPPELVAPPRTRPLSGLAAPPSPRPGPELAAGAAYLRARQQPDGLWRDYALEPGAAETWTTCCAALALAAADPEAHALAIDRARAAVRARGRAAGWGYNAATACDADSTAWAVRLLGAGAGALSPYLDADGHAHTFSHPERFGTWSDAHADVTAVVGLALVAARSPAWAVARVRSACLAGHRPDGGWRSFWWATDAYATARSLELLSVSGGLHARIAGAARAWLTATPAPASAFETAQLLDVAVLAGADHRPLRRALVAQQRADGGWPPSPALLVPDQRTGAPGPARADPGAIMTTAAALVALARAA